MESYKQKIDKASKSTTKSTEADHLIIGIGTFGVDPIWAFLDGEEWKDKGLMDIIKTAMDKILRGDYYEEEKLIIGGLKQELDNGAEILYKDGSKIRTLDDLRKYFAPKSEQGVSYYEVEICVLKPEAGGLYQDGRSLYIRY